MKVWTAAALLLCSTLCQAQDKSFVSIHGFDKMSCQDWFGSEGNPDVRQQYISWIRGVVTGYNYANPGDQVDAGRMPSDFGLGIYVDNYCHSLHATSVSGAAFALIAERRGSTVVQVIDSQPKADVKLSIKPKGAAGAGNDAPPANPSSAESPGFHEWLAKQSADIKSLGVDLQRDIYRREMGH